MNITVLNVVTVTAQYKMNGTYVVNVGCQQFFWLEIDFKRLPNGFKSHEDDEDCDIVLSVISI